MVERDLRLLELTGGRLHFAHVSTAAAIAAIRRAKARGLRVTCDTAPHYLALNELEVEGYRTFAKVSPPLRAEADRLRRRRRAQGRHHRRHRQRPLPAGPGQQAAAVRPGRAGRSTLGTVAGARPPVTISSGNANGSARTPAPASGDIARASDSHRQR